MPSASKRKGDRYENELAAFFNDALFSGSRRVMRTFMSGGGFTFDGAGLSDLIGLPDLHVEAKRVETLRIYDAVAQAERSVTARQSPDVPVVITRRNRMTTADSLVVLRLSNFLPMYEAWLRQKADDATNPPP